MIAPHPYLTDHLPGIGGQLKQEPEDFLVEEIPLYLPGGEGQHIYAVIEKRGLSTYEAIRRIARALNVSPKAIGYAGLKDAQAITRQTLSIDGVAPQAVEALDLAHINILAVDRHRNKLKMGHLIGNRFVIRVRGVTEEALPIVHQGLALLQERGVPNFFGEQRFGNRQNSHRQGEMIIRNNAAEFVAEYLGRPRSHETEQIQRARSLFDEGRWPEALEYWPANFSGERRVLAALIKADDRPETAFKALPRHLKRLFISAFQAYLFNQLLAQRIETLDRLETGDVAYIHGKGAAFIVEDAAAEQPRADRFEISPSGPLFGPKTLLAEGKPGRRERAILQQQKLTLADMAVRGAKLRGARRPYRFQLKQARAWWEEGVMVSFELPAGAYATTVMAELMK